MLFGLGIVVPLPPPLEEDVVVPAPRPLVALQPQPAATAKTSTDSNVAVRERRVAPAIPAKCLVWIEVMSLPEQRRRFRHCVGRI
jgi:hypothetical protein